MQAAYRLLACPHSWSWSRSLGPSACSVCALGRASPLTRTLAAHLLGTMALVAKMHIDQTQGVLGALLGAAKGGPHSRDDLGDALPQVI